MSSFFNYLDHAISEQLGREHVVSKKVSAAIREILGLGYDEYSSIWRDGNHPAHTPKSELLFSHFDWSLSPQGCHFWDSLDEQYREALEEKSSENTEDESEARIDIIGQNGNDGDHYSEVEEDSHEALTFGPLKEPTLPGDGVVPVSPVRPTFLEKLGVDPDGKDLHSPGAKADSGKNRLGLVLGQFSRSLQAVGEVGTYGANKYTDNGWVEVPNAESRYRDALLRHYFADAAGEVVDKVEDGGSGLEHLAHVAWNALAILDLRIRTKERRAIAAPIIARLNEKHRANSQDCENLLSIRHELDRRLLADAEHPSLVQHNIKEGLTRDMGDKILEKYYDKLESSFERDTLTVVHELKLAVFTIDELEDYVRHRINRSQIR